MSRLEAPTETPYLPSTCVYARALVLQMEVDIAVRSMVRVADAPGSSETFLNPLRLSGGSPALVGYLQSAASPLHCAYWVGQLIVSLSGGGGGGFTHNKKYPNNIPRKRKQQLSSSFVEDTQLSY
jgi:hypothetical protein